MTHTRFESIGAYLPETILSTRDLMKDMAFTPMFDLEQITGIKNRRVYDKREESFEDSFALAMAAAKDCLSRSKYRAEDLDIIISASITRFKGGFYNHFEPSFGLMLGRALGAHSAIHFDVSNACAGMMTGVHILDRMIKAGIVRNGMVVSGECITPIAETAVKEITENHDPQFGSLTVGDTGAAVILDESTAENDRIHYIELATAADYAKLCIGKPSDKTGGSALYTNNSEMHKKERVLLWPRFQKALLEKRGTTFEKEGFDYIVHHQVGANAIRKFSEYGSPILESKMPESLTVLEDLGNTATTSHFVVLHKHLKEKRVKSGSKILLVPAASGLVFGCVSTTISSIQI